MHPGFFLYYTRGLLLSVPTDAYDDASFAAMDQAVAQIRASGCDRLMLFNQPFPGTPIPRGDAARQLRALFQRERDLITAVVNAIPGTGFWVSAARVFLRALSLAYRDRPITWCQDVREASAWALRQADLLGLDVPYTDPEDLARWLERGLKEAGFPGLG